MNKVVASPQEAIADMKDGATIAIAGFSVNHGFATNLLVALRDLLHAARELPTLVVTDFSIGARS